MFRLRGHILLSGTMLTYISRDTMSSKLFRHRVIFPAKSNSNEEELRKTKFVFGIHQLQIERSN